MLLWEKCDIHGVWFLFLWTTGWRWQGWLNKNFCGPCFYIWSFFNHVFTSLWKNELLEWWRNEEEIKMGFSFLLNLNRAPNDFLWAYASIRLSTAVITFNNKISFSKLIKILPDFVNIYFIINITHTFSPTKTIAWCPLSE